MKKNIFFLLALIAVCATLLIGCGGGGGGGSNPASTTKTGTLQGTVSIPTESLRASTDIASDVRGKMFLTSHGKEFFPIMVSRIFMLR